MQRYLLEYPSTLVHVKDDTRSKVACYRLCTEHGRRRTCRVRVQWIDDINKVNKDKACITTLAINNLFLNLELDWLLFRRVKVAVIRIETVISMNKNAISITSTQHKPTPH